MQKKWLECTRLTWFALSPSKASIFRGDHTQLSSASCSLICTPLPQPCVMQPSSHQGTLCIDYWCFSCKVPETPRMADRVRTSAVLSPTRFPTRFPEGNPHESTSPSSAYSHPTPLVACPIKAGQEPSKQQEENNKVRRRCRHNSVVGHLSGPGRGPNRSSQLSRLCSLGPFLGYWQQFAPDPAPAGPACSFQSCTGSHLRPQQCLPHPMLHSPPPAQGPKLY